MIWNPLPIVFHISFEPLVWSSKKQKVVFILTTEIEYCGAINADIGGMGCIALRRAHISSRSINFQVLW